MDITVINLYLDLFIVIKSIHYFKITSSLTLLKIFLMPKIISTHPFTNILSVGILLQMITKNIDFGNEDRYRLFTFFQLFVIYSEQALFIFLADLLKLPTLPFVVIRVLMKLVKEITEAANSQTPQTNYRPLFIIHTIYNQSQFLSQLPQNIFNSHYLVGTFIKIKNNDIKCSNLYILNYLRQNDLYTIQMQKNYEQLKAKFHDNVDKIQAGPNNNRSVNDILCYLVFVCIILTMLILGSYVMSDQSTALRQIISEFSDQNSSNILAIVFTNYKGVISICYLISVLISFIYLVLVRCFPKCMVFLLIMMAFCIIFAILILGIASNNTGLVITMALSLFFFAVFVYFCWDSLNLGIQLLQIAAKFTSQKPTVYLASIWVFFLTVIFFIFWTVSVVAVQCKANTKTQAGNSTSQQLGILAYFIFVYIFITIFFYYVLSFLISTACAMWYYGTTGNYWCEGTTRINKYHIGSFTLAALLLTFIKILKLLLNAKNNESDNACTKFVVCLVNCCLSRIEYMIQVMNNTAVIVMAVTGENYCDSAQTASYVIFNNMGLFASVQMISNLVMLGGIIFSVGIPTIIGVLYIQKHFPNVTDNELDHIGLVILFGSIIIILFLVSTLCQSLSSVFVFYCLDQKLNESGCVIAAPTILKELDQYRSQEKDNKLQTSNELQEKNI